MIAYDGKEYARLLLEETLSNDALHHLESAVREFLGRNKGIIGPAETELTNLANLIRSHGQHLVAEARARKAETAIDPLLA